MKKNSIRKSADNFDGIVLKYVEKTLPSEDRAKFEEDLKQSEMAKREVDDLELITRAMKSHKEEIFCPETWELYEFARTGEDRADRISKHLNHCSVCREEVEAFEESGMERAIASEAHAAFKKHFAKPSPERIGEQLVTLVSRFRSYLSSLFEAPFVPLAAAAAVVLLVVLIYPRGDLETRLGLSSVSWDQAHNLGSPKAVVKRQKVAVVVAFRGFQQPWEQDAIDSLYRQLEPADEARSHFEFVAPADLSGALAKEADKPFDRSGILATLRKDFQVSKVFLVTVLSKGERPDIEIEVVDAESGKALKKATRTAVGQADLPKEAAAALEALLKP